MDTKTATKTPQLFLVCGLGSLGQYCVAALKGFGVPVHAIEARSQVHWEILDFPEQLDHLVVGDCRQVAVLEQAGIQHCRAVLIVTSDERVNVATAFAARSRNPHVRLVVRSAKENLNDLLEQQLGNFIAFEATQLSAPSFALAALGSEVEGFFTLDDQLLQVTKVSLPPGHRWCDRRLLHELNTSTRRVLSLASPHTPPATRFYDWDPEHPLRDGDTVAYIEMPDKLWGVRSQTGRSAPTPRPHRWSWLSRLRNWRQLRITVAQFWQHANQAQRVAILASLTMLGLFLGIMALYQLYYPDMTVQDAFNAAVLLVIGGYDGLFGERRLTDPPPWWLHTASVLTTIAGTLFIGVLYALVTERVLAARFQFLKRRPPVPKAGHVVLIGLGRVGQRVGDLLQAWRQTFVAISPTTTDPGLLPEAPLVMGTIPTVLERVNLATAKSVVVVTDDEVANLEIGLTVRRVNPQCNLVLRTFDEQFAKNADRLLPDARVMGVYALAAEAFAGAAFGENIINLFRVGHLTALVTEYAIEADDTLNGRLLSEIAHGYGVVPILHQRPDQSSSRLLPSDDLRLHAGDRLVVLATIEGLQRVERGQLQRGHWGVRIEAILSEQAEFEAVATIARVTGCDLSRATDLMHHLPAQLPFALHKHQALRLVRELGKMQTRATLLRQPPPPSPNLNHRKP